MRWFVLLLALGCGSSPTGTEVVPIRIGEPVESNEAPIVVGDLSRGVPLYVRLFVQQGQALPERLRFQIGRQPSQACNTEQTENEFGCVFRGWFEGAGEYVVNATYVAVDGIAEEREYAFDAAENVRSVNLRIGVSLDRTLNESRFTIRNVSPRMQSRFTIERPGRDRPTGVESAEPSPVLTDGAFIAGNLEDEPRYLVPATGDEAVGARVFLRCRDHSCVGAWVVIGISGRAGIRVRIRHQHPRWQMEDLVSGNVRNGSDGELLLECGRGDCSSVEYYGQVRIGRGK